ncbi:MAG: hypothetical protein R2730_00305 [Chitinophagales bacterium]
MTIANEELNNALFQLIHADQSIDWKAVNELVTQGADVNAINKDGHNILTYFLDELWMSGMDLVINEGALQAEAEFDRQLAIVNQLIDLGVKADHIVAEDDSTCLDYVRFTNNYKLIEPLIKAGANPNRKSEEDGCTVIDDIASDIHITHGHPIPVGYWEAMYQILLKYDEQNLSGD